MCVHSHFYNIINLQKEPFHSRLWVKSSSSIVSTFVSVTGNAEHMPNSGPNERFHATDPNDVKLLVGCKTTI